MATKRVSRADLERYLRKFRSDILEGARISQRPIRSFPSEGGPAVATLDRPATLTFNTTMDEVRALTNAGRRRRVLLKIAIDGVRSSEDYSVYVFLSEPEANTDTPYTDAHFLGGVGFFCHVESEGEMFCATPEHPAHFQLDATALVRALSDAPGGDQMSATLVLIPFENRRPSNETMSISGAELVVVESIIEKRF